MIIIKIIINNNNKIIIRRRLINNNNNYDDDNIGSLHSYHAITTSLLRPIYDSGGVVVVWVMMIITHTTY